MPFLNKDDFTVTRLDHKRWMTEHPLAWRGHHGDCVDVEAGFVTDFATVPWFVQWLIPRTGTWTLPAVGHDKLCVLAKERYDRVQSLIAQGRSDLAMQVPPLAFGPVDLDGAFRAMLEDEDVDPIRRWLLWIGVRWGAAGGAHRRAGWWKTAHLVLPISALVAAPVAAVGYVFVRGLIAVLQ